jgi:hypothetical protein
MSHQISLRGSALALLVSLSSAIAGPALAGVDVPDNGRTLTIEAAIDIAKRCVLERNVRLVSSYIESRFVRNPRGDRGPFWQMTWAYSREIKGGQVFIAVFVNRTCEVTYGEGPNNTFELTVKHCGPHLSATRSSWSAAQLGRLAGTMHRRIEAQMKKVATAIVLALFAPIWTSSLGAQVSPQPPSTSAPAKATLFRK